MITITAKINLSENGGTISSLMSNAEGNNVSAKISGVLGKKAVNIGKPFILGESKLDCGYQYTDQSVPFFISRQLSLSNGNFANSYTISLQGNNISSAIIVFDKENFGHPNSIVVDGVTFYDDDPQFELVFSNTSNTHTIQISNWNKPNSPLIITSIYAGLDIDVDRKNLISFRSDIIDRSNVQYPSFGIISNSANLTFADFDEMALDLISQQILHSGIKVQVWLDNTETNTSEQVCVMETRELSYDNNNRQVQLSLKDNLEELQDINIDAINFDPQSGESRTARWFYEKLIAKTPSRYNMLLFANLDSKTQDVLESTTIQYPLLESGTLWDAWQKLCELCMLHIYVDNNGKTVCKYNDGN